ncbi:ZYRO0G01584p [Zygosaccharomyces rouxii]|uniref:Structural maintenance of chromosomes protein 5 n=1 Tax=Zygosaccharomyces rouxii (strain ATCC 2623 / CBS 732 / NBRC 1130 / NCYC 568 / NRRL Y-229) TaxID=559307 RepID=C5E1U6_ZYGRC|nr:uncharacterized protein ZYRO0G01584g [Zygosaccharomyces rouxii]KAH9202137.1 P-loop containing nucleoside triphosphate hydrolase protein [Zygosaccharomyces rouxii]CAR29139.1 ZYRO0G01584p [Zygosaccharomyces rouxii]
MASTTLNLAEYAEDGPASKKLKLGTVDYSPFHPGAIVKMRLENFVTYTLTEFDLSPSLNMIIGPNGSGKSTFVCAVCLGLAGKPEFIKRSKRVEDFIKNGEDRGSIEITLKNSPKVEGMPGVDSEADTIKITRELIKSKSKSRYMINDRVVSEEDVRLLVSKLNIQLDNLCQFLSQERVEEFARLKSDKLLAETTRSIDAKLLDVLELLKDLQAKEISSQRELDLNKQKYDELLVQKEKLSESVKAFKELESKKSELELHLQLLPYAKLKDHKEKLADYKRDLDQAKANLKSLRKDKKPFSNAKQNLEERLEILSNKRDLKDKQLKEDQASYRRVEQELESIREEIEKKEQQIEYYRNRTKKLEETAAKTREELENKYKLLETIELPSQSVFDEITSQRHDLILREANLNESILELDNRASGINHNMRHLEKQMDNRLNSLNSNDRIGVLDQNPDLKEVKAAVLYIRSRPEMRGKVLEPPIMSVSVTNPAFARYLNHCVDYNTSKAFTIVDADSYEQFSDDVLKRFKVNLRELNDANVRPPLDRQVLRNAGFESYLSDFVTGDQNVIRMLCQICNLHTVPVSRKELSSEQLSKLSKPAKNGEVLFRRIIHGNRVVDFRKSLYGSKQVFSVDSNIKNTQFYNKSVMSEEQKTRINEEVAQLKSRHVGLRNDLDELSREKNDLKHQLNDNNLKNDMIAQRAHSLNEIRKKHSLTKSNIESLEVKIRQITYESNKDVTQKIKDVEAEISTQLQKQTRTLREMVSLVGKMNQHQRELADADIAELEAQNLNISMNDVLRSFIEREAELEEEYAAKKRNAKEMRDTDEYREWKSQIQTYDEETKDKVNDRATNYEENHNFNVTYIQDIIDRLESEIGMLNHDESSVTILSQVEKQLRGLQKTLPRQVEELNEIRNLLRENQHVLEPQLDAMISNISTRFSKLFTSVGSAGTVHLEKPHLFAEWKIEIMVKFRDNAVLKKLDSHTQSGGERAVSTVLYMIALQEFTTAPFRVVDEINQGMDSRNERIVHKSMVENACAENTSQYFLITPKLLTDLYYHEKMRVHCVMAGPWIPDPMKRSDMINFGQTSNYVFYS